MPFGAGDANREEKKPRCPQVQENIFRDTNIFTLTTFRVPRWFFSRPRFLFEKQAFRRDAFTDFP